MTRLAVLGATGQTGGATARAVLAAGHSLRVILHNSDTAYSWLALGAEVVFADVEDPQQLTAALDGADAAFLMNPPAYADPDPFAVAARRADHFAAAASGSSVGRIVLLSAIAAHLPAGNGMIRTNHLFEQRLADIGKPVTFLRPGYFLENWAAIRASLLADGILPSMLLPLDTALPMVGVADIGSLAARLMSEVWTGRRIVELAGQTNLSPTGVAALAGKVLGRTIIPVAVPRERWAQIFTDAGMSPVSVGAMVGMFDGFNNGTIRFQFNPRRPPTRPLDALRAIFS